MNNEDCPTCQQHIDESFKDNMINKENAKSQKLNSGMDELSEELKQTQKKVNRYK